MLQKDWKAFLDASSEDCVAKRLRLFLRGSSIEETYQRENHAWDAYREEFTLPGVSEGQIGSEQRKQYLGEIEDMHSLLIQRLEEGWLAHFTEFDVKIMRNFVVPSKPKYIVGCMGTSKDLIDELPQYIVTGPSIN